MSKQKKMHLKHKINVYEVIVNYQSYVGTVDEIAEQLNWSVSNVRLNGKVVGQRFTKIKVVNKHTKEVFYGTLEEVADWSFLSLNYIRASMQKGRSNNHYEFIFTGQYIVRMFNAEKPGVIKPKTDYTAAKPKRKQQAIGMSDYWNDMFRWSVKHLQ